MFCLHQYIDDYTSGTVVCIQCGDVSSIVLIDDTQEYRFFEKERFHYTSCSKDINGDDEFKEYDNNIFELKNQCERLNLKNDCIEYAILLFKKYNKIKNKKLLIDACIYVASEKFSYSLIKFNDIVKDPSLNKIINHISEQLTTNQKSLVPNDETDNLIIVYGDLFSTLNSDNKKNLRELISQMIDIKKNIKFSNKSNEVLFASLLSLGNQNLLKISNAMHISPSVIKKTRDLIYNEYYVENA
jgi:transcription initiation factor TFIIIB Brf1 subunit/transcription initiation factor TFIIB